MKRFMAAIAAACLSFCNLALAQGLDALPWVRGPATGKLGEEATIQVPAGYLYLDPAGAREFNRLTENPDPGRDEYVLASEDLAWVAFFSYDPVGYIKDDEKLDADDLLDSVTEGTETSNEERRSNGWEQIHVTGWSFKPQYDSQIKSLEWAFRLKGDHSEGETINYNTRLLGRRGVMEVLLMTSPEGLHASVSDFKRQLPGFAFNPGESYADFRPGDHVAEYGLAALVTGGAVVAASKKGFFAAIAVFLAKIWKLVLVGFVAVGSGVRKLFSKKDEKTVK